MRSWGERDPKGQPCRRKGSPGSCSLFPSTRTKAVEDTEGCCLQARGELSPGTVPRHVGVDLQPRTEAVVEGPAIRLLLAKPRRHRSPRGGPWPP